MNVFCDTSVLVAACIRKHPHFSRARPVLEDVAQGRARGFVSSHSLAELFSALTSVPTSPRILPSEARDIVNTNILPHFQFVTATKDMYLRAVERCVDRGVGGGMIYDALLIECALQREPRRIFTFNLKDFHRLAPELSDRITAP